MKVKTQYEGMTLTDKYLSVHFKLTVGDTLVRHSIVKIPVNVGTNEVLAGYMDRAARRRLLEVWSDEPLPPWED